MKTFKGKLAVVTGGGTGMGRELAIQLAGQGCDVAICDITAERMAETQRLCAEATPAGVRFTIHVCDVADEEQVIAFRDAVAAEHQTEHLNLLFNNAGIGGGGSFVNGDRGEWERTFGICWGGVYNCTRAFLPMAVASDEAVIVNTSSVNGFWASLGPTTPHTAYSAAKFAVKGFTEALMTDLKVSAPHVRATLVMPGHIGTEIVANSFRMHGGNDPLEMSTEEVAQLRDRIQQMGMDTATLDDDAIRQFVHQQATDFRDKAPLSAAAAATVILEGVRDGRWRILVGEDAAALDQLVRSDPESAYEESFFARLLKEGHFGPAAGGQ